MIWDYYGFAVGTKNIDPLYFWDEMSLEELSALFKAHNKENTEQWERTRFVAYHSIQWGKNPPKITAFLPLESDKGSSTNENTKLTKEQRDMRAKQIAKCLKF